MCFCMFFLLKQTRARERRGKDFDPPGVDFGSPGTDFPTLSSVPWLLPFPFLSGPWAVLPAVPRNLARRNARSDETDTDFDFEFLAGGLRQQTGRRRPKDHQCEGYDYDHNCASTKATTTSTITRMVASRETATKKTITTPT